MLKTEAYEQFEARSHILWCPVSKFLDANTSFLLLRSETPSSRPLRRGQQLRSGRVSIFCRVVSFAGNAMRKSLQCVRFSMLRSDKSQSRFNLLATFWKCAYQLAIEIPSLAYA
jgi:hypothetical protein